MGLAPAATLRAGGHVAHALVNQGLGEDGGSGGAVTGNVVGLGGHFLQGLGTHVLEGVFELDLLGDGDTVVGDRGHTELLLDDDVAASRSEGDPDAVGHRVDTRLQRLAGIIVELELLGHPLLLVGDGEDVATVEDEEVLTVDGNLRAAVLAVDDDVADLDVDGNQFARLLGSAAGTGSKDLALLGLLVGRVRNDSLAGADDDAVFEGPEVHCGVDLR